MPTTSRTTLLLGPDYAAVLSRYASSISLKSHLSDISLANVLSGDTCSPISLADFEAYLAFSEHSLENLHFVVWFQDYRQRFFALPELVQATSPGPKAFSFSLPTPARTAQRIASSTQRTDTCLLSPATSLSLASTSSASSGTPYTPPAHQPFRAECARVAAAFLHPRASKELPLDSALRDAILRDLTWNTHPDVFLPAYEETHDALASVSLPRFLAGAAANVNRPKQLFWYATGLADTLLALIVALSLIAAGRPARAWRLFAVPLAALGAMQAYSAWRGFCSQVWGRGGTQLRAWELQGTDVEAPAEPHWDWEGAALSRASSVPDEKGKAREAPHESKNQQPQEAEGEKKDAPAPALRRPPVFGPERVVLDPRIRAVHRAVMRDILFVGFWWTLVFTAVVLAVPGVQRG